MVPGMTKKVSVPVGSMAPAPRKMNVEIVRVAASPTKGVLNVTALALTPDTVVSNGGPKVKSVLAKVFRLTRRGGQRAPAFG